MSTNTAPIETFLADYQVPNYLVDHVSLHFDLDRSDTKVRSVLSMRRNPEGQGGDCILDGEQMTLVSIKLDGKPLQGNEYQRTDKSLLISAVPEQFDLEI